MTTNQERAAEVIASAGAICGSDCTRTPADPITDCPRCVWCIGAYAQALADAGLLAPDLPTDGTVGIGSGEWSAGFEYEDYSDGNLTAIHQAHASAWAPGIVSISAPSRMTTDQAEGLALAVLAAVHSDRQIAARANQEKK